MSDILSDLKDRKKREEEVLARLEEAADTAKEIHSLQKQQDSLNKKIADYVYADKPEAGTIKRFLEAPLASMSPIDPIYRANTTGASPLSNKYLNTIAKSYAKQLRDSIATMVSGKDYLNERKYGHDLVKDQMGLTGNAATVAGLALDVGTDLTNFVKWPVAAFNVIKSIGKAGIEFASKTPKVEKGIEAIRRNMNVFYDIEKTMPAEDVAKFKQGVQEWVATGKTSMLESLGYDMRKYANTKAGTDVIDPSTKANYKFKGQREFVKDTTELLKARTEYENSLKGIDAAKRHLAELKLAEQFPAASKTTLNTLWNKSENVRNAIDAELAAKHAEKEIAARAARTTNAAKNTKAIANAEAEVMRLEKVAQEKAAKSEALIAKEVAAKNRQVTKGNNIDSSKLAIETSRSKLGIKDALEDINMLSASIEDEQALLRSLSTILTNDNILLYAKTQKNLTKLQKQRSALYKQIDAESANVITVDNIGKGKIGPYQPGFDARIVGDTQGQFSAKATKAQAEAQVAYAKVEEAKAKLTQLKRNAAGPAITDATPKTLKAPAKLAGDIDVGSYKFVREIANKNLADLNPTEIKELEAMLVQWKSIATNNPHQRGSYLKKFAEDTLQLLKSGQLTKGPKEGISNAEKTLNDLLSASNIAKQKLDKATNAAKVIEKGYDDYYKILDEIAEPAVPKTEIGKGLDKYLGKPIDFTSNLFKRGMSWSPIFQSRNAAGGVIQGVSEGSTFSSYMQSLGLIVSKGKTNPVLYDQAKKGGALSQTGMYEQSVERLPGKVANFVESVNRVALTIADMNKGIPVMDALAHSMKTFYQYDEKMLTSFQRLVLKRIDPFIAFDIGQMKFFPESLAKRSTFYNTASKIKQSTLPEDERNNPYLTPTYRKDQFSIGSYGNSGSQAEDFLRLANLNWGAAYSKVAPAIKAMAESTFDYNVFAKKRISTDNKAGQIEFLPEPIRKLFRYDDKSKTVEPWLKWGAGIMLGPMMKPILNAADPNKGFLSTVTSAREYDTSTAAMQRQYVMGKRNDAKGGFWDNNRFTDLFSGTNVGPRSASATQPANPTATPMKIVSESGFISAKELNRWNKTYGNNTFGVIRNPDASNNAQDQEYRSKQTTLQNIIRMAADATNDIGVNAENVHKLELRQIYERYKYEGKLGTEQHKQEMEWAEAKYRTTAPRTYGQDPYLDITTRDKHRRSPGNSAINQFRNKALDEFVAERSKIMELNRSLVVTSPESLQRERDADLKGLELKYKTQYGYMSKEDYEDHAKAIVEKYGRAMADLEAKGKTATAHLLETWAKSEINGFQKIELERKAALTKYQGTDEYRMAEAAKNYQFIKNMEEAINAEYDQKRRDQLAKEAKAHMEHVRMITKGQAEVIIKALEDIYKRGGKTIKEFYGEKLATRSDQYSQDAVSAINWAQSLLQSGMKDAPGSIQGRKINYTVEPLKGKKLGAEKIKQISDDFAEVIKISKTLDEFYEKLGVFNASAKGVKIDIDILNAEKNNAKDAFDNLEAIKKIFLDPKADISQRINAVKEALKLLAQKLQGVDPIAIEEAVKTLSSAADNLTNESNAASAGITTDTATLNRAITDLHANAAKLRSQVYATTGIRTLGLRSTSGASTKFGYNTTPFAPTGYNRDAEALKTELDSVDASASQFFQKNTDTEGELAFKAKTIDQSDSGYLMQIETELQKHENNKANISETGKKKLEALQENYAAFVMTSENKIAISQEQVMQKRLTTAGYMAGMMTQTAEMIYEATGKQSKEAFYAMKALAIAEATIKGVQSVISAFKAGNDVGGPTVGAIYAGIASAFVGTQVGILTSQMINGPDTKADGGPITGGSGRKDDVPILAMGGEYIIKKSSVNKYGASFLDALNRGLIPANSINFSIPTLPVYDSSQVHFADGGPVVGTGSVPITVELKNESGTKLKQTKSNVEFNGQEYVVSVWLDALERNVGGLRTTLGG